MRVATSSGRRQSTIESGIPRIITISFAGVAVWGAKEVLASEGSVHPDYEIVIEATYQAQITPWLVVQPDLQYIIHPGGTRDFGTETEMDKWCA